MPHDLPQIFYKPSLQNLNLPYLYHTHKPLTMLSLLLSLLRSILLTSLSITVYTTIHLLLTSTLNRLLHNLNLANKPTSSSHTSLCSEYLSLPRSNPRHQDFFYFTTIICTCSFIGAPAYLAFAKLVLWCL